MQVEESKKWWTGTLVPPDQADASIQWEVYAGFRKLTPRWRHTWSVKYGAGILPTRRNMKIRKHCDDQSCPCCGADVEDTSHLFQCENEEIQKTYEEELDIVKNYLSTTTSITIKNLVVNMLNHLRNGTAPEITEDSEEDRIIFYQLQLGQRATLNGLWLQSWMDLQDTFLKRIRSRKSPKVMAHQAIIAAPSEINKKRHEELDQDITEIYRDRPHFKLLPTCDEAFLKRGQAKVKRYRIRKKELWVSDARRILEAYNDSLDASSEAFLDFFVIPDNTL
eukprot:CAMPEP_0170977090 /NCGR_PEP_ID=MMETSP0736-20130129/347_1 /TAXON_ID=186038 /ORGANISM="Fragilariopsis kerguelensis, Strain L26-C5" /LENGTH=278 /DNA_ID=CAMNT_0011399103 /DNA_START=360 /DNA_END=1195 /DNA_ORIENTATION=+